MKKIFLIKLSLLAVLCICMLPISQASAEIKTKVIDGFVYSEAETGIIIKAYIGTDEIINIPAKIDGEDVISIENFVFAGMPWIKKVVLPEGLLRINQYAFRGCTGITEISFPQSLSSIGAGAFEDCTGLNEIKITKGINSISPGAFAIGSLERITIEEGNSNYILDQNCLMSISGEHKCLLIALDGFKIPDYTTVIGDLCFYNNKCNKNIIAIELPDTVEEIGSNAFKGCENLLTLVMPRNLQKLGNDAFADCNNLREVVFHEKTVIEVNTKAMFFSSSSKKLEALELPYGAIANNIFVIKYPKLEYLRIRDDMTEIGKVKAPLLKRIEIPESVVTIPEAAFRSCPEVTIYGVEGSSIHEYAMRNGIAFESIENK